MPTVLIADDQPDVLEALRLLLKPEGLAVEMASSPGAVIRAVGAREFDLVLVDLNYSRDTTSGAEGLDLLEQLHAYDPTLPVVVMTAWATIDLVVDAMRRGARDFVQKPWDNARVLSIIRNQIALGRALRLVIIGVGIGVVAALATTRVMASLLYGVTANDPV
ncbi:MAG TPA: response regulator, partial [Thermoanaerobaculia bacterium]|nr:response regulator [Thermoanaerobaculia bacterium]